MILPDHHDDHREDVVAAVVIVGTVIASMGASFGLSVLVWPDILGIELYWMVLAMSVILLLAVGSGLQSTMISRLKREWGRLNTGIIRCMVPGSGDGCRHGVRRYHVVICVQRFASVVRSVPPALGLLFDTLVVRSFVKRRTKNR